MGFALDFHTVSSEYIGDNEYGHPQFETTRTDLGELLYRLKYQRDTSVVTEIVDAAVAFIEKCQLNIELIIPVPASRFRIDQPVILLVNELSGRLGVPFSECVQKSRDAPELKNIYDYSERIRILEDIYNVDALLVREKRILVFDDLYRSGATMSAVTAALLDQGGAAEIFALTMTRTRSRL